MRRGICVWVVWIMVTGISAAESDDGFAPNPANAELLTQLGIAPADSVADSVSGVEKPSIPAGGSESAEMRPAETPPTIAQTPLDSLLRREKMIQDSIAAIESVLRNLCAAIESALPPLAPKDEFETTEAFQKRRAEWEKNRDARCAADRVPLEKTLSELRKTKDQILAQLARYRGNLRVESVPAGAVVRLQNREVGKTPLELRDLPVGRQNLEISLNGYQDYWALPEVRGGETVRFTAYLVENSPFSPARELNLSTLLLRDTDDVRVYLDRIGQIRARLVETEQELKALLEDLRLKNPLAPKNEFETSAAFQERERLWNQKMDSLKVDLLSRHARYRSRLLRAETVLRDYILNMAQKPRPVEVPAQDLSFQEYNADSMRYAIVVEHNREGKPFRFEGVMQISPDEARATRKNPEGFSITAYYYDIPVMYNDAWIYPAWHSLQIDKAGKNFPTQGIFKLPAGWKADSSVQRALAFADSVKRGWIVPRNLTADYALRPESAVGQGWWRVALRGVLMTASATGLAYGYWQEREAARLADQYNPRNLDEADAQLRDIRDAEKRRDYGYAIGGILAVCAVIAWTF